MRIPQLLLFQLIIAIFLLSSTKFCIIYVFFCPSGEPLALLSGFRAEGMRTDREFQKVLPRQFHEATKKKYCIRIQAEILHARLERRK